MKPVPNAAILTGFLLGAPALGDPEKYVMDPSHSQIVFSYDHLGYSTNYGMFSGFGGEILFDVENPAASSVFVSIPVHSMITGWQARFDQFMGAEFFDASEEDAITFTSTRIDVTGEGRAQITGDLAMNGQTQPIVLEAVLNQAGQHPILGTDWAGFDARATLKRSDFDLGQFAPFISDAVDIRISIEAMKVEPAEN